MVTECNLNSSVMVRYLFEELRNNFIIYFSICIISVSFNEVSSICSKMNLEVLSRYCGIEESGAEKDKQ